MWVTFCFDTRYLSSRYLLRLWMPARARSNSLSSCNLERTIREESTS